MKPTPDVFDADTVAAAEPGFVARQHLSELARLRATTSAAGLPFSQLYRYALAGAGQGADPALEAALAGDARMRADLRHLIAKTGSHRRLGSVVLEQVSTIRRAKTWILDYAESADRSRGHCRPLRRLRARSMGRAA